MHLTTYADSETAERQEEFLNQVVKNFFGSKVAFTWDIDSSPSSMRGVS